MKRQADKPEKMEVVRDDAACAIQSIIDAYKDTVFKFYATDWIGVTGFFDFKPCGVTKLKNNEFILNGDTNYGRESFKGKIVINFVKNDVYHITRRTRRKYPLEVDNRTKKEWDAFLSELKSVHDRIIASAKDAASAMKKATELRLQALTDSIFSEVSSSVSLLFIEDNPRDRQSYPVAFTLKRVYTAEEEAIVLDGDLKVSYHKPTKGCITYNNEDFIFARGHLTGRGNVKIDARLMVNDAYPENVALLNKLTTHISNFMKGKDKEHNS